MGFSRSFSAGIIKALARVVWPPRCVACGASSLSLGEAAEPFGDAFCGNCLESLLPWSEPGCPRCGEPFESGPSHLCGACLVSPPPFADLVAALLYGGAGAEAVIRLKHSRSPWAAAPLGRLMARLVTPRRPPLDGQPLVVPVPLHPRRLRERGFNQSALLAREIARQSGLGFRADLLVRSRETRPRKGLSRRERFEDLDGAFAAAGGEGLAGAHILLVDDVVTTGATVRAASRALRGEGAAAVRVACLARAAMGSFP